MEYISAENQRTLSLRFRTAMLLAVAHAVSVILIIVVARFVQPEEVVPGSERLINIVPGIVIALALSVVLLRRFWMSRVIFKSPAMPAVNVVLNKLVQMTIICAAVSEIIAIVGFIFYLLTGGYQYSLILSVVSLTLIFYTAFPRRGEWERAVIASANAQPK